jgi:hypothetical protein
MELKSLKPRLGNWLTIEELRSFFAEVPAEIGEKIPINRKLLETAAAFVEERKGWWEHHDWESFLGRLHEQGFNLSEEVKAPIGNILEIFKSYYHSNRFNTIAEKRRRQPQPAVQGQKAASASSTKRACRRPMKEA